MRSNKYWRFSISPLSGTVPAGWARPPEGTFKSEGTEGDGVAEDVEDEDVWGVYAGLEVEIELDVLEVLVLELEDGV
jgi:hypothetical protein